MSDDKITDAEIIFFCRRNGIKAVDIARYLDISKGTVSKIQSKKIKKLNNEAHSKLVAFYTFLKSIS